MTIPLSDGSGDLVYLGTTTKVVIPSQYLKPERISAFGLVLWLVM